VQRKNIPAFYFEDSQLIALGEKYSDSFASAQPFPHVVIDNFVPEDILDIVEEEFPTIDAINWKMWGPGGTQSTNTKNIEKVGTSEESEFGLFTRHFMGQLNSATFVKFIQSLTGVSDIITDPFYNGCGFHTTGKGGKLMVHTDTNRHPICNQNLIHQRFNLILFLNKNWKEEYGGHLELWDKDLSHCEKKIAPLFNRCVIFDTGTRSYHGHPQPLTCPEGRRRNSLAVYYYSLTRSSDDNYTGMQDQVTWSVTTVEEKAWKQRDEKMKKSFKARAKRTLKKILPPIIVDGYHRLHK